MATEENRLFYIIDGPGKFELMTALFVGDSDNTRVTIGRNDTREVHSLYLRSVEMEDGSNENWLIAGYLIKDKVWRQIKGYYSTKKRSGNFRFIRTLAMLIR
jgi:hypothetical protein